jgi:hypothetical protein
VPRAGAGPGRGRAGRHFVIMICRGGWADPAGVRCAPPASRSFGDPGRVVASADRVARQLRQRLGGRLAQTGRRRQHRAAEVQRVELLGG